MGCVPIKKMLIGKIGEFGLIERIKKAARTDASVIKGPGDDCAVVKFDDVQYMLLTSDMLVEGVDFTLQAKPFLIGRKALAVSLSDIAACGGIPRYALVSLGMPKKTSVRFVDDVLRGMHALAKTHKVNIVGGDISRAGRLVFDVAVVGLVEKENLVLRSGAKKGDVVLVSGPLGGSILGKHLTFTPRLKEARHLVRHYKIHAMIDISDGLSQDLNHILQASRVGALLYEESIPLARYAKGLRDALSMGEDFELLFTMSPREADRLLKKERIPFWAIGEIVDKGSGLTLIDKNNHAVRIKPQGFRHF
jgi:thiamine-monophosphate kinase